MYTDDLILMTVIREELRRKLKEWYMSSVAKELKMNVRETKLMVNISDTGVMTASGVWPCGVKLPARFSVHQL